MNTILKYGLIFILCVPLLSKGQQSADSLFNVARQTKNNLLKIETLAQITSHAKEYEIKDVIQAIEWMDSLAQDSTEVYLVYIQNNDLGNYFRYLGFDSEGLKYFEKNNIISQQFRLMPEYLNIGLIYEDQNDYGTARTYFLKNRDQDFQYGPNNQAYGYYFYGNSILKEKPDSGKFYIDTAIAIWESLPIGSPSEIYYSDKREPGALTQAYYNLAMDAIRNRDMVAADFYVKKVRQWNKISECNNHEYYYLKATINIKNKTLDSTLYYAKRNLEYAQKVGCGGYIRKGLIANAHALLAKIYEESDSIHKAFAHYKMYVKLRNAIKSSSNQKAVQFHKYEKDRIKLEQEHQEEIATKKNQRNMAFLSGLLLLIIATGFFSRWRSVKKSRSKLQKEKDRSESLLLNILPAEVAAELKEKGKADARDFEEVSILFTDFVSFTEKAVKLSAKELVQEINECFEAFDGIIEKYKVEKIKTIGDAYMAAGGLPVPTDDSVKNTVLAALEMQDFIAKRKAENDAANKSAFEMRVGIHTGPIVAGIVGIKKFQYDVWGDTVNTASRMESAGEVGKVNISQATYELLKTDPDFAFESRGKIEAKGKGTLEMYFVSVKESQDEA